ncbi:UNVERIFIED_CONTAM: Pentatricopeptide repeat-containing protein, mitochondrial [Sesamum radiatum]|uniref:Pentatricopeptide repeat-containing protein, mitochondrial n=1 Tax=Sesamum radiatum TaxID=300843 RepID=A0AAW2N759_SESRA
MQLFNSMEQEHGVVPTREHFSCVVDLLARAGCIHDAEAFINQMVFEPDIVMWKALLAACKNRCNIEVGKRVAENILKMDPSNSAAHVLLCSMYASAGGWKDVATMRTLMREKGVKKVPGQSWIEVKDRVHVFSAEDGLHPERDRIVSMLEELWLQIVDADYIPSPE